ncbi:tyrosine-type recombinase/integrase [bacterium]|nr:tyrosine-type recombinase/integrase [bacterium]
MASLYRRTSTRIDRLTGEKIREKSKKWWGRYRDHQNIERRVPLATDKTAAQTLLNELVKKAEKRRVGLIDQFDEHAATTFLKHLEDFKKTIEQRQNTKHYVTQTIQRIKLVLVQCRFVYPRDLVVGKVETFLANLRKGGRSIQTSNYYLQSMNQFLRWMVRNGRLLTNPLVQIRPLNARTDRRHDRRALTETELAKIIEVASVGKIVEGVDGPTRAMAYKVSMMTGIRRSELGSLTKESFDLDAPLPTVTVAAGYSKHRREDVLPLHSSIVPDLRDWLATKKPKAAVFAGFENKDTAKMIQVDLKSAGIPYRDERGRFADWHALRHSFITMLAKSGVAPATARQLARHSDINLTLSRYAHVELEDQRAALETLPGLDGAVKIHRSKPVPDVPSNGIVPIFVPCTPSPPKADGPAPPLSPSEPSSIASNRAAELPLEVVPILVPTGARNGAKHASVPGARMSPADTAPLTDSANGLVPKAMMNGPKNPANGHTSRVLTQPNAVRQPTDFLLPPSGFEPLTDGLEILDFEVYGGDDKGAKTLDFLGKAGNPAFFNSWARSRLMVRNSQF